MESENSSKLIREQIEKSWVMAMAIFGRMQARQRADRTGQPQPGSYEDDVIDVKVIEVESPSLPLG